MRGNHACVIGYGDRTQEDGSGSLLPLWKFAPDMTRKKTVTSLCWNPQYNDMFAAGYAARTKPRSRSVPGPHLLRGCAAQGAAAATGGWEMAL